MRETLPVIYMKCAFCTAKTRCEACGRELDTALMENSGIHTAVVNVPEKTVRLEHELDPDTLEELLEDAGLFLG